MDILAKPLSESCNASEYTCMFTTWVALTNLHINVKPSFVIYAYHWKVIQDAFIELLNYHKTGYYNGLIDSSVVIEELCID